MENKFLKYLDIMIANGNKLISMDKNGNMYHSENLAKLWEQKCILYLKKTIDNETFLKEFLDCRDFVNYNRKDEIDYATTFYYQLNYLKTLKELIDDDIIPLSKSPLLRNENSNKVFVAMWFDQIVKDLYDLGIKPILEGLGYEGIRVDEHQHNNKIDLEILKLIEESKFLIVDLTGNRGGCYFEAGYAKGLGLQIIYSVKRDDFEKVHFDINHDNIIIWDTIQQFKEKLEKRIKHTFGNIKRDLQEISF